MRWKVITTIAVICLLAGLSPVPNPAEANEPDPHQRGTVVTLPEIEECYANGDANNDGLALSVADRTYLAIYLNSAGPEPIPLYSCDLNGDGFVNQADLGVFDDFFTFGLTAFDPYGGYPVPCPCEGGCCTNLTGNVNGDPSDMCDIGDLTALIGYLFIPPFAPPACMDEANTNGEGTVDIGDLTALIGYLFIPPFTLPAPC